MNPARSVREFSGTGQAAFEAEVAARSEPLVVRGLMRDWPLVAAAGEDPRAVARHLAQFDRGSKAKVFRADAGQGGRFFYTDAMDGFNFDTVQMPLSALMDMLIAGQDDPAAPTLYAGSASTPEHLPGFAEANPMPLGPGATPRIWIGNATHISTHYDASHNIAVVAMGRRRFTLFPPDQLPNLYVGPLDMTIAGQPVSMVDLRAPDLERFPRFAEAMETAQVAELEPGDAIFIPMLWWHNVVAQDPFNILVNYWYGQPPNGSPFVALVHAMQAIRELPEQDRAAWQIWFDHYVFSKGAPERADHLPPHARGVLGPASPSRTSAIAEYVRRALTPR